MPFDPYSRLRKRNQRQQSDVAQKLIAMCLHQLSTALVRSDPRLRVETPEYERAVRAHFGVNCAFCEAPLTGDVHVEHLDAMNRVRAGLHIAGNVVLSCKACNMAKRNDDQGKGALQGNDGWRNFLSHTGTACPTECSQCKHWRDQMPDEETRLRTLSSRAARIESFRAQFPVSALRTSSLAMVSELEQMYREWQDNAQRGTRVFVERHARALIAALPERLTSSSAAPSPTRGLSVAPPTAAAPRGLGTSVGVDSVVEVFAPGEYYAGGGSLPIPLTLSALEAYLKDRQFDVDNNRATGGGFWVKLAPEFLETQQSLERLGLEVRIATRRNVPGEWILVDGKKQLR